MQEPEKFEVPPVEHDNQINEVEAEINNNEDNAEEELNENINEEVEEEFLPAADLYPEEEELAYKLYEELVKMRANIQIEAKLEADKSDHKENLKRLDR